VATANLAETLRLLFRCNTWAGIPKIAVSWLIS